MQRAHLQFELLERIVDALRLDPARQAAALVGSLADGRGDRVSDVDLIVFADNRQAGSRAGEGRSPGHDATQAFARGDAELAWELFNCVKRAARGDLAGTKAYIVELAAAILRADAATSPVC